MVSGHRSFKLRTANLKSKVQVWIWKQRLSSLRKDNFSIKDEHQGPKMLRHIIQLWLMLSALKLNFKSQPRWLLNLRVRKFRCRNCNRMLLHQFKQRTLKQFWRRRTPQQQQRRSTHQTCHPRLQTTTSLSQWATRQALKWAIRKMCTTGRPFTKQRPLSSWQPTPSRCTRPRRIATIQRTLDWTPTTVQVSRICMSSLSRVASMALVLEA